MDLTHIQLRLNRFPAIGMIVVGGLFLLALTSIPTCMTGNGAQVGIKSLPGVWKSPIGAHEGAVLVAMGFMEVLGAFAWLGTVAVPPPLPSETA